MSEAMRNGQCDRIQQLCFHFLKRRLVRVRYGLSFTFDEDESQPSPNAPLVQALAEGYCPLLEHLIIHFHETFGTDIDELPVGCPLPPHDKSSSLPQAQNLQCHRCHSECPCANDHLAAQ